MPLGKADYGDFSGSDPLLMALRQALDYWAPGEAPADPRGARVSEIGRTPQPVKQLPPVQIDLAALMGEPQAPQQDPLAMGQPQPAPPPGWGMETGRGELLEPGGAPPEPGMPIPERGARPGLPERNPAFHTTAELLFDSPELQTPGDATTQDVTPRLEAPTVPQFMGSEAAFLESLGPTDRAKMDKELLNARQFTPEQAAANRANLGQEALSILPLIGNTMSAEMAFSEGDKALSALGEGDYKDAGIAALLATLGGFGAVTGMPTGKLAGSVAREGRNTLGVFAGPTSKTADLKALERAREMEKSGADRTQVWNETGWFRGPERKWRYEIPDNEAALKPEVATALKRRSKSPAYEGPLEGAFDHPQLFEAYPGLAGGPEGYQLKRAGIFSSDDAGRYYSNRDRIETSAPNRHEARDTGLHEIQHALQKRENFARGGSLQGTAEGQDLLQLEASRRFLQALDNPRNKGRNEADLYRESIAEARRKLEDDFYVRNAGEVEARNVELRADMTPAERRATPPWMTQEVPDEGQIVTGMGAHRPEMEPAFVPVAPDDPMQETAKLLYANAPRSYGARTSRDALNANVHKATGTFFGPEGALLREVGGGQVANRSFAAGDVAPLKDVLEYPALYRSMPNIGETPVKFTTDRLPSTGGPIARTTDEGFEITAGMKNKYRRRQLEKLTQYQIGKEGGLSGSFRDSLDSKISDMEDAISQARLAMTVGALSPETGRAYIKSLEDELGLVNTAFALARTKPEQIPALKAKGFTSHKGVYPAPSDVRSAMKEDLHRRGAGNAVSRAAQARLNNGAEGYPLKPGNMPLWQGAESALDVMPSMSDMVVLPQKNMDVLELAAMLENWKRYGPGAGR